MPPTRRDFLNLVTDEQRIQERAAVMAAGLLRTAALKAQQLTEHPAWDAYLQQLEALRLEAEQARQASHEALPGVRTIEDMIKYQQAYWFQAGREAGLAKAMALPQQLILAHRGGSSPSEHT